MSKKSTSKFFLSFFMFVFLLLPLSVHADDAKLALRLLGQISPFISGEAGSGSGAPDYDDAFNTGLGMGAEVSWRFSQRLSFLGGIGYENYDGDSHDDISFDDLGIVPLYLGAKIHFNLDKSKWDPYLRMDVGAAHLSSVDVSFGSLSGKYWDSSWVFLCDAGAGVEYRWDRWGASLEVKLRYMGEPDSAMGKPSDADASWSVPVVFGINYHF